MSIENDQSQDFILREAGGDPDLLEALRYRELIVDKATKYGIQIAREESAGPAQRELIWEYHGVTRHIRRLKDQKGIGQPEPGDMRAELEAADLSYNLLPEDL